ncbi:gluconokinase [Enterococcus faecalis]|uniref:gluconokinase n=1 Tax=Enterococcus faecalis TaxID=1351 RepID=UPI00201CCC93|nr:gluconokinase [Enterococcus faecalis]URA01355.1 gluconokinase [Enterococcus faecalis]
MEKLAIGVDVGTTQAKAVAFQANGTVVASSYVRYPLIQETEGMAEQDPETLFQAVVNCIRTVTQQVKNQPIGLISFASAMHGLIAMDAQGRPLTQVITWADTRASDYAEALKETPAAQLFYQLTGMPVHPMAPLYKIRWLQENQPAVAQSAAKFIGIKDYIFYRFFGEYWTDYSSASGMGLFNIHTRQWESSILAYLSIEEEQLPKVAPSTFIFPALAPSWQEMLGVEEETVLVLGGASSNGAVALDWASQTIFAEERQQAIQNGTNLYDPIMAKIATVPAGANGLLFHPYLLGERAPLWNAEASASFIGLRKNHHAGHLARAVVEGICFNLKTILEDLKQLGGPVQEIRATGGFADSPVFRQIMADVLGETLSFTDSTEASALGAVLLGWQGLGQLPNLQAAAQQVLIHETVTPRADQLLVYQELYPVFQETQQVLAQSYQKLAEFRK